MGEVFYAHTSKSKHSEDLIDHLRLTAQLAAQNGLSFQQEKVCEQLGLLHDIGKRTEAFRQVLARKSFHRDHAIVAGILFMQLMELPYLEKEILSMVMSAHHDGLYMNSDMLAGLFSLKRIEENRCTHADKHLSGCLTLKEMTVKDGQEWNDIVNYVEHHHLLLSLTEHDFLDVNQMSLNERMFYVRMLLSCLVDADYSATISYEDTTYLQQYVYSDVFDVDVFLSKFDAYYRQFQIENNVSKFDMNLIRKMVYADCVKRSIEKPSFFTLTAPTGSGKTLALMKFALEHAKQYGMKKIIIVLPFLSIIEQNGEVYKQIFGDDMVLIDDSETEYTEDTRIYADRWSSPIIVTTSVKFFHTLFSCQTTKLRKLHQVSNSVIVFDECQTLNPDVLSTSIEILQSLVRYYRSSVVFSTGTALAYEYRDREPLIEKGFVTKYKTLPDKIISRRHWHSTEIISDVDNMFALYDKLKNTDVVCKSKDQKMTCTDLWEFYKDEQQVLYVFNTVKHAEEMYQELLLHVNENDCFLITSHFSKVDKKWLIEQIRTRLKQNQPVVLVATQCIEAGVDFDFPVGAREYGPLDSIIQAAGRINRNGKYVGKYLIFCYDSDSKGQYPSVSYKEASDKTYSLLQRFIRKSLYDMFLMNRYSKKLYQNGNYATDSQKLIDEIQEEDYQGVTQAYQLIEQRTQVTVLVPSLFTDNTKFEELVKNLQKQDFCMTRRMMKDFSKYTISLFVNKNICMSNIGVPLFVYGKKEKVVVNWYLVTNPNCYSKKGFCFVEDKEDFFL